MKSIFVAAAAIFVSAGLVSVGVWGTCQVPMASSGHCAPEEDPMPLGQCCFASTAEVKTSDAAKPVLAAMEFSDRSSTVEPPAPHAAPDPAATGPPGHRSDPLQMICVLRI